MGLQRTLQDPRLNEVAAVLRVACQTGLVQATAGLPGRRGGIGSPSWGEGSREGGREDGRMELHEQADRWRNMYMIVIRCQGP